MKVEFGPEALEYIEGQLANGLTLSQNLLQLKLVRSHCWAFVPDNVSADRMKEFDSGGIGGRPGTELALVEFMREDLLAAQGRCAIFEDAYARSGDPVLATPDVPYFTHRGEVYDFLAGPSESLDSLPRLLWTARAYRMIGVLSEFDALEAGQAISADRLKSVALQTRHVIVGAWDGEGELIWTIEQPAWGI